MRTYYILWDLLQNEVPPSGTVFTDYFVAQKAASDYFNPSGYWDNICFLQTPDWIYHSSSGNTNISYKIIGQEMIPPTLVGASVGVVMRYDIFDDEFSGETTVTYSIDDGSGKIISTAPTDLVDKLIPGITGV